jgi:Effector-associated domain 4/NACHT domain/HEAT repeats
MPRPTYGPEVKRRTAGLFALLLDYANDELEADEKALDGLRSQFQLNWQSDQRLVVRTKVRSLHSLSKLSPTPLTADQIKESLRRLGDFLDILEDNRPSASGSETWHFTLKLWGSRRDRTALLDRFAQEWESRRAHRERRDPPISDSSCNPADPWLARCESSLTTHLTTNPLTVRDRITFEWRALYVPLGIIPRPAIPQLSTTEVDPEPREIPQSPDHFLAQLLNSESCCRVAIVGEPGTGKTTLLQNLAWGLLQAQKLPIWVSLADLQDTTLEQFLLSEWLKTVSRQFRVSPELQQDFATQVQQGRVWLLLDAIDEMALEPSAALSAIARQLKGWLGDAHVILTCRSHVWDSGKNALEDFESYCNLSFQDQTQAFIQQWFSTQSELGDRLWAELSKPDRIRIRDTVKNPLRLALLCRTWSLHQGFPTTKSMLYHQFVEALYDWKQDRMPTSFGQRQQLNQALGELAIAALLNRQTRFRLQHSFILKVWHHAAEFLPLALNLGWLIPVGIQSGSGEKMYAFYHPTFQEYFAAQAIDNWEILGANWLTQILESQWREVVLFWLGRSDLEASQKEKLLLSLQQFEDQIGFYRPRAYCLAAEGLAEFPESTIKVADQLIDWRFGHYNAEHEVWQWYPPILQTASLTALMRTDRAIATQTYETYLAKQPAFFAKWHAAYSLGNAIAPKHPLALSILRDLIEEADSTFFKIRLCEGLARVNPGDEIAITTLRAILEETQEDGVRRKTAHCLGRMIQDESAIAILEQLAQTAEPPIKRQAAASLAQLIPGHPLGIVERSRPRKRQPRQNDRPEATIIREIESLTHKLEKPYNLNAKVRYAYRLGKMSPGNLQAIQTLLSVLQEPNHESGVYRWTSDCLSEILTPETRPTAIATLHPLLPPHHIPHTPQTSAAYGILWDIAQLLPYDAFIACLST